MPFLDKTEAKAHELSEEIRISAKAFDRAFAVIRELRKDINANHIEAFFRVAMRPGGGATDYAREMNVHSGQVSRWMLELGERSRNGNPGLGLIERLRGNEDLREVHYLLTPKGKALLQKILDELDGL